jgi:hypothetical protein
MCYGTQICRPCQCSGEGNGRYGDNRKWKDFFDENKLNALKKQYSNKWQGELNPSKKDYVKIKKNQLIINKESIEEICNNLGFKLIELLKLDAKKGQKWRCGRCFYDSIGINLSDEEILKFEKYRKQVRALTAKTYRNFKSFINPNDLVNGKYDYHIDHKYSVYEGFKNNVDVKIISSKENLQMLYYLDNLSKGVGCSIQLGELLIKTRYLL